MRNKNIVRLAVITAVILAVPLIAMQFTEEVMWTLSDFIFAGVLIFGTGLAYELVAKKTTVTGYRAGVALALATMFLLVWLSGAVGIIGSENNPANVVYFGVIGIGIIGTAIARLRPTGMAWTMFLTAGVLAVASVFALAVVALDARDIVKVIVLNSLFTVLLATSGLLFLHTANKQNSLVH